MDCKKTRYSTKITETKNKIPSVNGLVTNAAVNAKATRIENKMFVITNLVIKTAVKTKATEVENKIPGTLGFIILLNLID